VDVKSSALIFATPFLYDIQSQGQHGADGGADDAPADGEAKNKEELELREQQQEQQPKAETSQEEEAAATEDA